MRAVLGKSKYLLWFANEHVDFRLPEIESLVTYFKINLNIETKEKETPFWIVELESEKDARLLASRSVSLKAVLHLWGYGETAKEFHESVRLCPPQVTGQVLSKDRSFRVDVTTFNRSFTMKEKVERIESFDYLNVEGPVDLKTPDSILHYIEYYGLDPNVAPESPFQYYFGHWICDGQRSKISELSLKNRLFIGNTSMDAQLSLMMANMACVGPGDFVFDPFVGSGSLLVAAASYGAHVCGADIDFLMLHGKTRPTRKQVRDRPRVAESVLANLKQYNLASKYVDVIVADSSLPLLRPQFPFDAIITDPPYGVRESTERIGTCRGFVNTICKEHLATHVPSKVEYSLACLFADLLSFAGKHLTLGGRLVSWIPVRRGTEFDPPTHPAFTLLASSEQPLSALTARRLLTWKKVDDVPDATPVISDKFVANFRQMHFEREETRKERRKARRENRSNDDSLPS